jgi:hypothetical protein
MACYIVLYLNKYWTKIEVQKVNGLQIYIYICIYIYVYIYTVIMPFIIHHDHVACRNMDHR